MNFHQARFTASYGPQDTLPRGSSPEIALAGRSNVGKSSLINKLVYRKNLARISQTPGKTVTINFYDLDGATLVDLPGYGYASVSKVERQSWQRFTQKYFETGRPLALVACLMDSRHEPTALDHAMVDYLKDLELPFCVVLTKVDKLSRQASLRSKAQAAKALAVPTDDIILTSATTGAGVDDLRAVIAHSIGDFS